MSEVSKIQAVQRSLAIAQRVTSSALTEAKKNRSAPSLAGGKKRRSSSPKKSSGKGKSGKKSSSKKGRR